MRLRSILTALAGLLFTTLMAAPAFSQATISFAQLNGTIQDTAGRTVPKASITLREVTTNQTYSATSSDSGYFVVPALSPGSYELTVTSSGFGRYTRTGIVLTVGQTATINVELKVAAVNETVTVTTEAPVVETTRTEISQVIETQQIQALPISGRLFTDFALLTPSVAKSRTALGTTFTE
jgi:Carboxypeptidase regulatory-like domain